MALLDISLVTQALINLIQFSFKASDIWNPEGSCNSPKVSPLPPDKLDNDSVGLYLYYILEQPHLKNIPLSGKDNPLMREIPMDLSFFFQLTTHSDLQTEQATLNEQKMLGIAIKTLQDYPVIDDKTEIVDLLGNKNKVFPDGLCDGNIRLIIEWYQLSTHDALSYWKNGNTPLRLAVYYKVNIKIAV